MRRTTPQSRHHIAQGAQRSVDVLRLFQHLPAGFGLEHTFRALRDSHTATATHMQSQLPLSCQTLRANTRRCITARSTRLRMPVRRPLLAVTLHSRRTTMWDRDDRSLVLCEPTARRAVKSGASTQAQAHTQHNGTATQPQTHTCQARGRDGRKWEPLHAVAAHLLLDVWRRAQRSAWPRAVS